MKKRNQDLKIGDRVLLLHMEGVDLYDIEGIVKEISPIPKFTNEDLGFMYKVEWYDDEGNVISTLSMIPETDKWVKID